MLEQRPPLTICCPCPFSSPASIYCPELIELLWRVNTLNIWLLMTLWCHKLKVLTAEMTQFKCWKPRFHFSPNMAHTSNSNLWNPNLQTHPPPPSLHPHHQKLASSLSASPALHLTDSNVYSAIKTQPIKGNRFECQTHCRGAGGGLELQGEFISRFDADWRVWRSRFQSWESQKNWWFMAPHWSV